MEYEYTPREEIQWRTSRFQKSLRENNIAGALISQNADLFYFSGTIQPAQLFIPADGEPVLAVQENMARAQKESPLSRIVPLENNHKLGQVLSRYDKAVQGRTGLEMDVLPANLYVKLCRDLPEADFVDVSDLIKKARMVKSEYEIRQIKKAASILYAIMGEAQRSIRPGMTELEVDAKLVAMARRSGHQGRMRMRRYNQEMLNSHIFCGKTGAVPSYVKGPLGGQGVTPAVGQGASFNRITGNEPLVIDFGVGINGYVTDMTRTFVIGKLSEDLNRAYSFLKGVKDFMEHRARPGIVCSSLYEEIVEMAREKGYQDHFMGYKEHQMPFVGHGIGLEIDEYPLIAAGFDEELQENMVFAFEPKLVFPEIGAVGIEDDYRVTDTGVERLTTYDDGILTITAGKS